jgi:DnaK suppressor protein
MGESARLSPASTIKVCFKQKRADNRGQLIIVVQDSERMNASRKGSSRGKTGKTKPKPKPKTKRKPKTRPHPSSTSDILGGTAPKAKRAKINPKWARHYRNLLDLRGQLLVQAGKLAREATEGTPNYSMHMADAGTDSFDRDFALSMLSSDQDALYEIEEAIKRIESDTYGVCELTSKVIPLSRLDAIPWTRFSAEAQRQLEREGALKLRQLSAFSSLPAAETAEPEEGEEGGAEPPEKE